MCLGAILTNANVITTSILKIRPKLIFGTLLIVINHKLLYRNIEQGFENVLS